MSSLKQFADMVGGGVMVAARVIVALVAAFVFFSVVSLLSLMPEVLRGPHGLTNVSVSPLTATLCTIVPTRWFPFVATPLVWWSVYRGVQHVRLGATTVCVCVLGVLVGSAAHVSAIIVKLDAALALSAPDPTPKTLSVNIALLVLITVVIVGQEMCAGAKARAAASSDVQKDVNR
jgi:hypothetical protein